MKTIITKNIDGYNIITNFCDANGFIDPENTKKIVNKKIIETDIYKKIHDIKNQTQKLLIQSQNAFKNAKNAKKLKKESEFKKFTEEYNLRNLQIKDLQEDLKLLAIEFEKEYKNLVLQNSVYFEPKQNEKIVDDKIAENAKQKMIEAYENNKLLDENLNQIDDYRGTYWGKNDTIWNKFEIKKIGEQIKNGFINENKLTDEQKIEISEQLETERISKLSELKKEEEKLSIINSLKLLAVQKRSEFELDGDINALENAKKWLSDEILKVELKYA